MARIAGLLLVVLVGCGGAPPPKPRPVMDENMPLPRGPAAGECVVVGPELEPQPTTVEGTIRASAPDRPFVLELPHARCVVGLEHVGYLTDVSLATTGPDLRPLVGARVRVTGDAIAGKTDLGGPALVVLVREVERIPPAE